MPCEVEESGYCLLGVLQPPFRERLILPEVSASVSLRALWQAGETGSPLTGDANLVGNDPLPLKTLGQRVIFLSPFSAHPPCHPLPSLLGQQLKRAESPAHLVFLNSLASNLPLETIFTRTHFSLAFCPALEPSDSQGREVQTALVNSLHIRLSETRGEHPNS